MTSSESTSSNYRLCFTFHCMFVVTEWWGLLLLKYKKREVMMKKMGWWKDKLFLFGGGEQ